MRQERGQLPGGQIIFEPYELWGSVGGDVKVIKGGKFYHRGTIYGDLLIESGGRCHVFGNVTGDLLVEKGAKVIHSGVVLGNAINSGGRLYMDDTSTVIGKVKTTEDGETTGRPRHELPRHMQGKGR